MSTIKSSDEHLTLNADGASKDIKFQANGVEKASIDSSGNLTVSGNLTSLGIDDNADATAITIDSSENVGIGTTPETGWRSSAVGVDIGTGGAIAGYDGGSGAMQVLSNAYWHTSGGSGWKYKNSSYPATMLNSDGEFVFKTAGNGTADNAISWTTRLEIKEDGRGLSQFTAKAWINMNGTGTIAIRDSHNVSSISDVSTGNYTINLSNALANTDFSAVSDASNTASYNFFDSWENYSFRTTSRTQIRCYSADTYRDANSVSVVIFGD